MLRLLRATLGGVVTASLIVFGWAMVTFANFVAVSYLVRMVVIGIPLGTRTGVHSAH